MFKFDRRAAARSLLGPMFAVGLFACSSLTSTHSPPTSQTICEAYDDGVSRCGGDFDTATCQAQLACKLGLYRSEAVNLILSCKNRFDQEACPPLSGYFCDEPADKARLAGILVTPTINDFGQAFTSKRTECAKLGVTLDSSLYDERVLLTDTVLREARPCLNLTLDTANAMTAAQQCRSISECLVDIPGILVTFCQ